MKGHSNKGFHHSEESKKSISETLKGRKRSEETKKKISLANIGNKSRLGHKNTEEHNRKISEGNKGKKRSAEEKKRIGLFFKGKHITEEHKKKISETNKRIGHKPPITRYWLGKKRPQLSKEKHWHWKGGINSVIAYRARKKNAGGFHTKEQWEILKKKYNYMCLCCKKQEPFIKLSEDHIIPIYVWNDWAETNKPRYKGNDIENIQPLCVSCNVSKNTKIVDYREQFQTNFV